MQTRMTLLEEDINPSAPRDMIDYKKKQKLTVPWRVQEILLFLNKKPWCFGVKSHPVLTPGSQFSSSSPKKIWSTINNNEWVVVNRRAFDSSWIVVEDVTVECGSVVLTLTYKLADE